MECVINAADPSREINDDHLARGDAMRLYDGRPMRVMSNDRPGWAVDRAPSGTFFFTLAAGDSIVLCYPRDAENSEDYWPGKHVSESIII